MPTTSETSHFSDPMVSLSPPSSLNRLYIESLACTQEAHVGVFRTIRTSTYSASAFHEVFFSRKYRQDVNKASLLFLKQLLFSIAFLFARPFGICDLTQPSKHLRRKMRKLEMGKPLYAIFWTFAYSLKSSHNEQQNW